LVANINPGIRQNIERLAVYGYERDGRGALMVEINEDADLEIVSAQYLSMTQIAEMNKAIPFAEAQPVNEAIKKYKPDREFVALVLDVTPSLPNPLTWFDVFPRELTDKAAHLRTEGAPSVASEHAIAPRSNKSKKPRGRQAPPPTEKQQAAMATAYALIEDLARDGFAKHGRGFVFNGVSKGGNKDPFVEYMTLEEEPGRGFVATAPDLAEKVQQYDPRTSFVVFDATVNLRRNQLEDVRIDIFTFLTGRTTPSA